MTKPYLQIPKMRTTSDGRGHQTIKSRISKQPPIGSYNILRLRVDYHILQILTMKMTSVGRRPHNI
jgi:hypothetical protein